MTELTDLTLPTPTPSLDAPTRDLYDFLHRGASFTITSLAKSTVDGLALSVAQPLVAQFPQTEGLAERLGTKLATAQASLTLAFPGLSVLPNYFVLAFVNNPAADLTTSTEAPGFAGGVAFFIDPAHLQHETPSFHLPLGDLVAKASPKEPITVTLLARPMGTEKPAPEQLTVTATLEITQTTAR